MQIPTIHTDRLILVPPSAEAEQLYEAFYTDVQASAAYGGPLTPGAASARLAADLGTWHLCGFGVWVIQQLQQQDFVGVCGYWQGKGWPRELTWWLLPWNVMCFKFHSHPMPNLSFERTCTGAPRLAFISFWARRVPPAPAAQLKR
jgi:RimJ/RimL family protein N-acetyltransferase